MGRISKHTKRYNNIITTETRIVNIRMNSADFLRIASVLDFKTVEETVGYLVPISSERYRNRGGRAP